MFIKFIQQKNGDITFVDQGVQNGTLGRLGRSGILHPKYNCMTVFFAFDFEDLIKFRKPSVLTDPVEYKEAVEDPVIVHFQSCFKMSVRPWVKGCKHPYAAVYLEYKKKSPWRNEPMKPDDRTLSQKLLGLFSSLMPKKPMIEIVSFIHTRIYPFARKIRQKFSRK